MVSPGEVSEEGEYVLSWDACGGGRIHLGRHT